MWDQLIQDKKREETIWKNEKKLLNQCGNVKDSQKRCLVTKNSHEKWVRKFYKYTFWCCLELKSCHTCLNGKDLNRSVPSQESSILGRYVRRTNDSLLWHRIQRAVSTGQPGNMMQERIVERKKNVARVSRSV